MLQPTPILIRDALAQFRPRGDVEAAFVGHAESITLGELPVICKQLGLVFRWAPLSGRLTYDSEQNYHFQRDKTYVVILQGAGKELGVSMYVGDGGTELSSAWSSYRPLADISLPDPPPTNAAMLSLS